MHAIERYIRSHPKDTCFVCEEQGVADQHHIFPIEYGGPEDGLKVPLCPTDHDLIHREAEKQVRTGTKYKFVNTTKYDSNEQFERAKFLVDYVVRAKLNFISSGEKKAVGARNMMAVSFERDELAIAHDLKRRLGFKSLERMVKYLVLEKYREVNGKKK